MEKKIFIAIVTIGTFLFIDQLAWPLIGYEGVNEGWGYIMVRLLNRSFWYILIPFMVIAFLHKPKNTGTEIGLNKRVKQASGVAFVATLPMLLGYGFMANFNVSISWETLILGCALAAVGEEVLYRGFLFGQLHRRVGLWFILAAAASAIFFGVGHLYQGKALSDSVGIFLVTMAGGIWFSWLYKQWDYNLWVPILFHFLMNLYWSMFSAGDNALGGWEANVFRGLTIALSIVFTIRRNKSKEEQNQIVPPNPEKMEL